MLTWHAVLSSFKINLFINKTLLTSLDAKRAVTSDKSSHFYTQNKLKLKLNKLYSYTDRESKDGKQVLEEIRQQMRVRSYSFKTEKADLYWIEYFIRFNKLRQPRDMD